MRPHLLQPDSQLRRLSVNEDLSRFSFDAMSCIRAIVYHVANPSDELFAFIALVPNLGL